MANVNELPHDLIAEKALIGCLIIDGNGIDEISDLKLNRKHFYDPRFGILFEVIYELSEANRAIDYVTVCSKLQEKGKLEEIGGQSFVISIVDDQATSANVFDYAKIVRDKASMRDIVKKAMTIVQRGMTFSGDAEEFIQEVEKEIFEVTNESKTGGMIKLSASLKQNLKELEDTTRMMGEITGLSTGYPDLDSFLLGMQAGQLIILAARPAMGKTSLALNIAVHSCLQSKLPVAIFSLEMVATELSMRLLTGRAKVDSKRVRKKAFLDTDLRSISKATQELAQLPIFINDSGSTNLYDIQSQCRKIKAEQGLGLIVIDYLQLMGSTSKNIQREQQIAEISRGLKSMAKELECPVIALSQLNRAVETRPNKRPTTADLRESGSIEQDADIVMFVYRDEVYHQDTKEPGIAEVIIGKNRAGEIGTAKLAWVGAYTSFETLSFREQSR